MKPIADSLTRDDILAGLYERLGNCRRMAETDPDMRKGWLEDATFYEVAIDLIKQGAH